ncbi:hypothetical protein QA640_36050 [Bradyrhizobium sp. CB82]|uniref:hypothetical protein n=1 Tax=Bradyrhizobium sp. CB82 TaxID=3039159 RepID=UPI0024B18298|nr:hypothetical protein [Bradyrhizobium sp. CB82]WFU39714.1 hypothetical protein QA640_36050 [Bradyrhizobium sp. CB82]
MDSKILYLSSHTTTCPFRSEHLRSWIGIAGGSFEEVQRQNHALPGIVTEMVEMKTDEGRNAAA